VQDVSKIQAGKIKYSRNVKGCNT